MPPTEGAPSGDAELVLRPGTVEDLPAVAELYLRARAAAVPAIPPVAHPPDEVRAWVAAWDLGVHDLWLAEYDGRLAGFALVTATWLDQLYLEPDRTGRGVGSALLGLVKATRPDGFGLWVFESNHRARSFYRGHGLVEVERTDGSGNEERAPDVRMTWSGS